MPIGHETEDLRRPDEMTGGVKSTITAKSGKRPCKSLKDNRTRGLRDFIGKYMCLIDDQVRRSDEQQEPDG